MSSFGCLLLFLPSNPQSPPKKTALVLFRARVVREFCPPRFALEVLGGLAPLVSPLSPLSSLLSPLLSSSTPRSPDNFGLNLWPTRPPDYPKLKKRRFPKFIATLIFIQQSLCFRTRPGRWDVPFWVPPYCFCNRTPKAKKKKMR